MTPSERARTGSMQHSRATGRDAPPIAGRRKEPGPSRRKAYSARRGQTWDIDFKWLTWSNRAQAPGRGGQSLARQFPSLSFFFGKRPTLILRSAQTARRKWADVGRSASPEAGWVVLFSRGQTACPADDQREAGGDFSRAQNGLPARRSARIGGDRITGIRYVSSPACPHLPPSPGPERRQSTGARNHTHGHFIFREAGADDFFSRRYRIAGGSKPGARGGAKGPQGVLLVRPGSALGQRHDATSWRGEGWWGAQGEKQVPQGAKTISARITRNQRIRASSIGSNARRGEYGGRQARPKRSKEGAWLCLEAAGRRGTTKRLRTISRCRAGRATR